MSGNLIGSAITVGVALGAFATTDNFINDQTSVIDELISGAVGLGTLYVASRVGDKIQRIESDTLDDLLRLGLTGVIGGGMGLSLAAGSEMVENIVGAYGENPNFPSKEIGYGSALVFGTLAEYIGRNMKANAY